MNSKAARDSSGRRTGGALLCAVFLCASYASADDATRYAVKPWKAPELYASTYRPLPRVDTLLRNATVLDGAGAKLERADVLMRDGKIVAIGRDVAAPAGATVVDATGRWITPGIVDVHTHLGDFPAPYTTQDLMHSDVAEATKPNAADTWAEHSITVEDPQFTRALAGGVTTVQVLPGSRPLFGGRGVVLKTVPAPTMQGMKFPDAPQSLKMACGENPKFAFGDAGRFPSSRMGNVAGYRDAWAEAQEYLAKLERHGDEIARAERASGANPAVTPGDGRRGDRGGSGGKAGKPKKPPKPVEREFTEETLAGALVGDIPVHIHCYRADDMAVMIDVAREFGYSIAAFHHATEAYKIAPLLAQEGICAVVWSDWWGFKLEAYDGIRENAAFVDAAGACVVMHSDVASIGQRLNVETAKAMAAGRRAGVNVPPERAIRWITSNAAKLLRLDDRIGTLAPGKNADVVVWSGDPFGIYTHADLVYVDGALVHDRADPKRQPLVDFELGQPAQVPVRASAPVSAPAVASTPTRAFASGPASSAADTLAIVHARALTMTDAGEIADATLVLRDGRIVAVGVGLAPPPGARVVDARGRLVTPALMSAGTQLGITEVGGGVASDQSQTSGPFGAAFEVQYAVDPNATAIPLARADGLGRAVTFPTASAQAPFDGIAAVLRLVEHVPSAPPLVEVPRAGVFASVGGMSAFGAGGSRSAQWLWLRNALAETRECAARRARCDEAGPGQRLLSPVNRAALAPVVARTMPLAIHASRESDVREAIRLAVDYDVRVIVYGGAEAWRLADELAARSIPVVLDPLANVPATFDAIGARADNAALLRRAGVRIALSVPGVWMTHNAGSIVREAAGLAVANGLPWQDAMRALTVDAAGIWGLESRFGTLAPGQDADLVIWSGDPLESATSADTVIIAGREVTTRTRQDALRDRYAPQRASDPWPPAYRKP